MYAAGRAAGCSSPEAVASDWRAAMLHDLAAAPEPPILMSAARLRADVDAVREQDDDAEQAAPDEDVHGWMPDDLPDGS
ncbi:hypothetical protein ACODT3_36995 [Streptomyces sp. 4.24]|uniref:hypothetical protein n=1 Tax=Streptomyces tritrimontium TaxID=3406573 RepID=UPI003BB6D825